MSAQQTRNVRWVSFDPGALRGVCRGRRTSGSLAPEGTGLGVGCTMLRGSKGAWPRCFFHINQ